jgi:hypothetical protein
MEMNCHQSLAGHAVHMNHIVTCITIVRQWVGNTFPQKQTRGTIGHLLLSNRIVNTIFNKSRCYITVVEAE